MQGGRQAGVLTCTFPCPSLPPAPYLFPDLKPSLKHKTGTCMCLACLAPACPSLAQATPPFGCRLNSSPIPGLEHTCNNLLTFQHGRTGGGTSVLCLLPAFGLLSSPQTAHLLPPHTPKQDFTAWTDTFGMGRLHAIERTHAAAATCAAMLPRHMPFSLYAYIFLRGAFCFPFRVNSPSLLKEKENDIPCMQHACNLYPSSYCMKT